MQGFQATGACELWHLPWIQFGDRHFAHGVRSAEKQIKKRTASQAKTQRQHIQTHMYKEKGSQVKQTQTKWKPTKNEADTIN